MKVHPHRRPARLAVAFVSALLFVSGASLVGTAQAATEPPPAADPTVAGGFCDGAPNTNPFTDLGAESAGTREVILCLVASGITKGTTDTTYSPGDPVTRRQMALFIVRLGDLLEANETQSTDLPKLPAYDGSSDFSDVAATDPGAEAIGRLSQAGIVGGFDDGTYRPNDPVSRRQMAAFIVRLFDFLGTAPTATADYFDDDSGDSGEDNLNRLAEVGIFQGDGAGHVMPGADISRRQMANVLLRTAQVFVEAGEVSSPFPGPDTPSLALTPTAASSLVSIAGIDTTSPGDDRTYTASNLPASAGGYEIALFNAAMVYPQPDGSYRFTEEGNTGLADLGILTAKIVKINGSAAGPYQLVGGIQPVDGTITFTVDGDATDALIPIIHVDGGTDPRLEIDASGAPLEHLGVGGEIRYIPAEAAGGAPVSGTVSLVGPDFAVIDAGVSESTVYFQADDDYAEGSPTVTVVDAATFGQHLSTGDSLRTCDTSTGLPASYTQGAGSGYCLSDDAPVSPADLTTSAGSAATAVQLDWTATDPADAYNVYVNDEPCANTTVDELGKVGTVGAYATSYELTGLSAATTYCFVVTTVEAGDESAVAVGTAAADGDNTAQRAIA